MPDNTNTQTPQGTPFEIITTSGNKKLGTKSLFVFGIIFLLLAASIFAGVYLVGKRTNVEEKAAPATAMYISPGTQTKNPGNDFSFTVNMNTSVNSVTGVDVRLNFDSDVIQIQSLTAGSGISAFNQTISNTFDNNAGTVSFAVFTLNSTSAVQGTNVEVLKVNAKIKETATAGSYNITFNSSTAASASREGQNVLVSKAQGVVSVVQGSSTVSPTPTQASTVSPTPTSTASPASSASPQPTNPSSQPSPSPKVQTSPLPIPVSGASWPTYLGLALGVLTLIISAAAIF